MNKFCPNCGKPLEENNKFCGSCGKSQISEDGTLNSNQKSKLAAGLLGIFLGTFGVHNFYLGYNGKAVAQLLITILSCGILSVVSGIWGLIEGILILTDSITLDAEGNRLRD
ncbi:MAG: TM2 domain-containing protein [bacterium]|nr:TM2 domain-containing protein [bacterium]